MVRGLGARIRVCRGRDGAPPRGLCSPTSPRSENHHKNPNASRVRRCSHALPRPSSRSCVRFAPPPRAASLRRSRACARSAPARSVWWRSPPSPGPRSRSAPRRLREEAPEADRASRTPSVMPGHAWLGLQTVSQMGNIGRDGARRRRRRPRPARGSAARRRDHSGRRTADHQPRSPRRRDRRQSSPASRCNCWSTATASRSFCTQHSAQATEDHELCDSSRPGRAHRHPAAHRLVRASPARPSTGSRGVRAARARPVGSARPPPLAPSPSDARVCGRARGADRGAGRPTGDPRRADPQRVDHAAGRQLELDGRHRRVALAPRRGRARGPALSRDRPEGRRRRA